MAGSRATGSAVISLAHFAFRVKIYVSAVADKMEFKMISLKGNKVKQKLTDEVTGEEIDRASVLKGYEVEKDTFVTFTEEEVTNMQSAKKDMLDLTEFVPFDGIDLIQVEKTYYLAPDKGMDKQYKLMYEGLKAANMVAVGTWSARGKEHLVIIRAYQHGLVMHQMFYHTELRSFDDNCKPITPTDKEISLMGRLIKSMSKKSFDTEKYADHFAEIVAKAVEAKQRGEVVTPGAAPIATVISLEDALAASLEEVEEKPAKPAKAKRKAS